MTDQRLNTMSRGEHRPGLAEPILPTETVRVTTTYERAQEIEGALLGIGALKQDDGPLIGALRDVREGMGGPMRIRRYKENHGDIGYAKPVEPTRSDGGMHDDYRESHPAYGMISASRQQGRKVLAGSDFDHQNFMTVTVKRARRYRGLSSDRWHADNEVIEVNMSEAQWANFVSATNVGDGVPCTIGWTREEGHLPAIKRIDTRREETKREVAEDLDEATAFLDEMLADDRLPKWAREKATRARARLTDGIPFVLSSADEHMETLIEHAKIEFDAWATGAIMRAGIEAITGQTPLPIALPEPGEPTDV
jgi:hypothetical protein